MVAFSIIKIFYVGFKISGIELEQSSFVSCIIWVFVMASFCVGILSDLFLFPRFISSTTELFWWLNLQERIVKNNYNLECNSNRPTEKVIICFWQCSEIRAHFSRIIWNTYSTMPKNIQRKKGRQRSFCVFGCAQTVTNTVTYCRLCRKMEMWSSRPAEGKSSDKRKR